MSSTSGYHHPPAAQLYFAGFGALCRLGGGGTLSAWGRHQRCQVCCQTEGPPWQGSGEPTRRVEQLPLGTLHRPSFDLGLAAWLGRTKILAREIFLN